MAGNAGLQWDNIGERLYKTGTKNGVVYPYNTVSNKYDDGYAWNGLTSVSEKPSGAEVSDQYADDIKYLSLMSAEDFGFGIEAFFYPDAFKECDGTATPTPGMTIGQQKRKMFGFSYVTTVGNDTEQEDYGEEIHLIYGALASPSEKGFKTKSNSPEPLTFSWDCKTTPVKVGKLGDKEYAVTSTVTVSSRDYATEDLKAKYEALKDVLYGRGSYEKPMLPMPDEVYKILTTGSLS